MNAVLEIKVEYNEKTYTKVDEKYVLKFCKSSKDTGDIKIYSKCR